MKTSCIRGLRGIALAALLGLAAAPLAAAARPQQEKAESTPQPAPVQTIRYEIRYMDLHAAEQLAWDQCAQKNRCRIAVASQVGGLVKGIMDVGADPETQQKVSRALAREDAAPRTQSFQLLLLAASARTGSSAAEVPANAQKALADLRGFLPFKSYQLLDSSWLRATQDNVTEARVVGREGVSYRLRLRFRTTGNEEIFMEHFDMSEERSTPRPASEAKKGEEGIAPRAARDLISTSFSLKKGETIVVGTSKIDGSDEALVVLLTAVPQG
ncbi:MAG TPA: hypothetical protein VFC23_18820 [Thermoanaerobaculia bacterium]|nr:hypothetical protein [Thermoanaerobaculia bacterium]